MPTISNSNIIEQILQIVKGSTVVKHIFSPSSNGIPPADFTERGVTKFGRIFTADSAFFALQSDAVCGIL